LSAAFFRQALHQLDSVHWGFICGFFKWCSSVMVDRFEIGTMCCQEPDDFIAADSDGSMQGTGPAWRVTIYVKTEIDCQLNSVELAASCS
jgi:hypothetical protein